MNIALLKWLKWEFWPFWFFYIPLYVKYLWMSLKSGSMAFFTAANPLMIYGGFTDYSKYSVIKLIDKAFIPKGELIIDPSVEKVLGLMEVLKIDYPIILKPDKGERGFGVEKVDDDRALEQYFIDKKGIDDLILQDYANMPVELGVMYSKKQSEEKGLISSVVIKEFLKIVGDGKKTFLEIIESDQRARFYKESLEEIYHDRLNTIPSADQQIELMSIGNHCRGTMFLDGNHLINDQLLEVFDRIAKPIKGFHFGRFDLRVTSIDDLYQGVNIRVLELNGAASEPAHIYDPEMPLLKAYRHLFGHWQRLYEISIENHKNGTPYNSVWSLYKALKRRGDFKKTINNNT